MKALFQARIESQYKNVNERTVGIVFFGTPHRGSDKASYGNVLARVAAAVTSRPASPLIAALQTNSKELMKLTSEFRFQLPAYRVASFYETKTIAALSTLVRILPDSVTCRKISKANFVL
jgi:hypothetical protein